MDLKRLSKSDLMEMIERKKRKNLKLKARQVKICDLVKAWEEGSNPVTCMRKIANVVRYDE